MKFELYSYENKIPLNKCYEMLDILVSFYDEFNGMNNGSKDKYEPWINMIRNTKDYYVLLCYEKDVLIGFINYMYQDRGLMLSEIQIRKEYQNKGLLKVLLKEVKYNNKDIYLTIHKNNKRSKSVFEHIGFKNIENNLYKISYDDLMLILKKNY